MPVAQSKYAIRTINSARIGLSWKDQILTRIKKSRDSNHKPEKTGRKKRVALVQEPVIPEIQAKKYILLERRRTFLKSKIPRNSISILLVALPNQFVLDCRVYNSIFPLVSH